MSAWAKLLAASSLAFGTAWQLITHPKTGGAGTIVVDKVTLITEAGSAMTVDDTPVVVLFPDPISIHISQNEETITPSNQITFKVTP